MTASALAKKLRQINVSNIVVPPLPCLTLPLRGNSLEFLDETYPTKTRVIGLP